MCFSREFSSKELRSVGNYDLGRLIGKGSFGKVYLATHKLTNGSKVISDLHGSGLASRAYCTKRHQGCSQICEQGGLKPCPRDSPPSAVHPSTHSPFIRSNSYGETCLASFGILSWCVSGNALDVPIAHFSLLEQGMNSITICFAMDLYLPRGFRKFSLNLSVLLRMCTTCLVSIEISS